MSWPPRGPPEALRRGRVRTQGEARIVVRCAPGLGAVFFCSFCFEARLKWGVCSRKLIMSARNYLHCARRLGCPLRYHLSGSPLKLFSVAPLQQERDGKVRTGADRWASSLCKRGRRALSQRSRGQPMCSAVKAHKRATST